MTDIYRVDFFKQVTDSTGHPFEAHQGTIEIDAIDQGQAIALAREKFAEAKDVPVWWLRADYEKVEPLSAATLSLHATGIDPNTTPPRFARP